MEVYLSRFSGAVHLPVCLMRSGRWTLRIDSVVHLRGLWKRRRIGRGGKTKRKKSRRRNRKNRLKGGSKGLINFPWIFYEMRSLVPVGHFRNISGHLFTWLVCGSFQWRHGLFFTDCIVWNDKDKVICFERSHWIHLGWRSTGSPKLQPCFNYHSIHTSPTVDWCLLQPTFHEIWH